MYLCSTFCILTYKIRMRDIHLLNISVLAFSSFHCIIFYFLHQDFMFQLTDGEYENLRCKNSTSSWNGRRYNPYAFIVSLQKNAMKLKSSAVIWQGVIRKKQGVVIPWQGVKIKKQGV